MKQVLQYTNGELRVDDVPPPALNKGGVLVASRCSVVSAGTEKMTMDLAKKSLVGKALERPDLVKQVIHKMKTEGFSSTLQKVRGKLDAPIPLGYSCAGTVVAVAEDVDCFRVGDRVACAGQGYASHAEVVFVPKNLCVTIPECVSFEQAAYVTVGAIAMQGVRVADLTLGETVMIVGLGLLGQLAVQIVKSAGCKVLGVDIDCGRAELASKLGADAVVVRNKDDVAAVASDLSRGRGIDAAIITAATSSNDPIELAGEVLRDKGRVSVVGAVKMDIPRRSYYEKELDVRLSRSYGPGRYDVNYEERGVDYPIGYARWTERRNMESFLDLVAAGSVRTDELTTHTFDIADAQSAYDMIGSKDSEKFVGVLLKYPESADRLTASVTIKPPSPNGSGRIRVGMIGAGSFGQAVLLPRLAKLDNVELRSLCAQDGIQAKRAAQRFGASCATTDAAEIIGDANIDAVVIATRHDTHVPLATAALETGKNVFVEKPLALDPEQLEALVGARNNANREVVVDFNRRFAPLVVRMREILSARSRPLVMSYRINAGVVPKDSWIQDPVEGGGRIIGEVCHFVDLLQHVCGGRPERVYATAAHADNGERTNRDNVLITINFSDGSIGNIAYVADSDPRLPKERLEVFGNDSALVIDDFKSATFFHSGKMEKLGGQPQDKGHGAMLAAFFDFVSGKRDAPVPFEEAVAATRATFAVLESLGLGIGVAVG
ncbi:MAG: hypothetical protein A2Z18_08045 [Armatimonadetes bacterium RBG_16_58_9]|nr:MAG: hypothetical protein A2Z18_08045 [Armatimonadetes bacterium RBG_16_58_9]